MDLVDFERTGITKCESAFDDRAAARMRDVIWNELRHRHGIDRSDPTTWNRHPPSGLKSAKRSRAFAPICGPAAEAILDELFGAECWQRPKAFGNVLVTMPNTTHWRVPSAIWHADFPATLPAHALTVVKLWARVACRSRIPEVVPASTPNPSTICTRFDF